MTREIKNPDKFIEYYENLFNSLHRLGRTYFPEYESAKAKAKAALDTGYWDVQILFPSVAKAIDDMGALNIGICPKCGDYPIGRDESWIYAYTWNMGTHLFLCKKCWDKAVQLEAENTPKKKGCYIATVCYGSLQHENVITLQIYRDKILSKNVFGKLLIYFYYLLSPWIARHLEQKQKLNEDIRTRILEPLLNRIKHKYNL